MFSNNNESKVTIIRRMPETTSNTHNSNNIRRDHARFSYNSSTTRIVVPIKGEVKYSLRESINFPGPRSNQLDRNDTRASNLNESPFNIRDERPSISNVSYKSIDNKYGLIVRKVEHRHDFGLQSSVFSTNRQSEDIDSSTLHNTITKDNQEDNQFVSYFYDKEDMSVEQSSFDNIPKSDPYIFKRINADQYQPETEYPCEPPVLDAQQRPQEMPPSIYKSPLDDNAAMSVSYKPEIYPDTIQISMGIYKGDIINGMMNGIGQILDTNNFVIYDGGFKDNLFDGYGILFNQDALESKDGYFDNPHHIDKDRSFIDLNLVGNYWLKYEGIFKNDKKQKIGFWYLTNGDVFFGEFNDDRANGYGTYSMSNGSSIAAIWKDNRFIEAL